MACHCLSVKFYSVNPVCKFSGTHALWRAPSRPTGPQQSTPPPVWRVGGVPGEARHTSNPFRVGEGIG